MTTYGIFDDDADFTAEGAIESGFLSREEAEAAIEARYADEEGVIVHEVESIEQTGE